jgi:hypothetical protein
MLLSEQVRQLSDEENLVDDSTTYTKGAGGWGTIHSYGNIVLSEASLIVINFNVPNTYQAMRLKIGSYYVYGSNSPYGAHSLLAFVGSGTHEVIVEGRDGSGNQQVNNFKLGKAKFSDAQGSALAVYSSQISKTVASRATPAGPLKDAMFIIECWAYTPTAQTNFENVGDSLTNGVSLVIDSAQVNWSARNQDTTSSENAYANCYKILSVGSAHTIDISKDNANTVVHVSVYACPWILSADKLTPFDLEFSQGSTLYLKLEPLNLNPTKYVYLGKKRAVSFGDSTDYYSTSTGTGLLDWNYVFETVEVAAQILTVYGLGGCVSVVGADVR